MRRLSLRHKAALVAEVLGAYVRARRLLRTSGLPATLAELRKPTVRTPSVEATDDRLGRAVRRTLALLPGDTRCLMQSLVLTSLLARRGRPCHVVIGVAPRGEFTAHAWVERDGVALLPSHGRAFGRLAEL